MRRFLYAIEILILFFHEMLVCTFDVIVRIFRSNESLSPAIVCMPLETRTPAGLWILSLIISITPGSLIVETEEDRRHLYIHLFHAPDPDKWVRHMRQRFEKRIRLFLDETKGET